MALDGTVAYGIVLAAAAPGGGTGTLPAYHARGDPAPGVSPQGALAVLGLLAVPAWSLPAPYTRRGHRRRHRPGGRDADGPADPDRAGNVAARPTATLAGQELDLISDEGRLRTHIVQVGEYASFEASWCVRIRHSFAGAPAENSDEPPKVLRGIQPLEKEL